MPDGKVVLTRVRVVAHRDRTLGLLGVETLELVDDLSDCADCV